MSGVHVVVPKPCSRSPPSCHLGREDKGERVPTPEGEALGSQAAVYLFYDMWLPSDLEGPESACTPYPSQEKGEEAGLKPPPSQGTPVQEGPLACLQSILEAKQQQHKEPTEHLPCPGALCGLS